MQARLQSFEGISYHQNTFHLKISGLYTVTRSGIHDCGLIATTCIYVEYVKHMPSPLSCTKRWLI